jgi:hypothetical protein
MIIFMHKCIYFSLMLLKYTVPLFRVDVVRSGGSDGVMDDTVTKACLVGWGMVARSCNRFVNILCVSKRPSN